MSPDARRDISYTVNGQPITTTVAVRTTLLDHLRDDLRLHGTHVGCEHGVCGCCNVTVDGDVVRSCLMLAYQVDGSTVGTIEGIEGPSGELSPLQQAFCDHHGLQCGYCTPGMIVMLDALLRDNPRPTDGEVIDALSGNLCRCTGYQQIVDAVRATIAAPAPRDAVDGMPG